MRETLTSLIGDQRASLLALLANVTGDDWSRPTACPGWTVKDVLAHLLEGDLTLGRVYRGEIRESGPIDAEEGVKKWRPLPGEAVRATLWHHGTATQRALEALSVDTWRAPVQVFGCATIAQLVRLQLFDLSVHGHDLTDALDAEPLWSACLPFLVEFCVRAAPFTLHRLRVPAKSAVEIAVTGAEDRWVVDGRDGRWQLARAGEAPSRVTLAAEDLVLLATGRRSLEAVRPSTKIEGDYAAAENLLKNWRVV
ncbi:MAG: maleylpyruvate isomerase family mycothiol-dependent enzyme [Actinomycetota bacterium]